MSYIRSRKHPTSQQPGVQRAMAAAIASLAIPGIHGLAQAQSPAPAETSAQAPAQSPARPASRAQATLPEI
jgi:hypothetical protein